MNHDFETIFAHIDAAKAILEERRDYTSEGDDVCLDEYRVALNALARIEHALRQCCQFEGA